jgi:enamine deaminase RidA (YjgF/YER057c/UK114 family)
MTFRKITTPLVPEPAGGIYTNCFVVGDQVIMSGITASGPDGRPVGGDSMEGQARAVLGKIKSLVEAAGGSMADVAKVTVYVTDISRRPEVGKARADFFPGTKPCSTMVEIKGLVTPDLLIEIDALAILGAGGR